MKNLTATAAILVMAFSGITFAQDYNLSFETWLDHVTYEEPEYWGTFNPVTVVGIQALKDTNAMHGNYALKLSALSIPAGIAVLGTINPASGKITPGRPFTSRPERVACWYKTTLVGGDSSAIVFNLTKYDPVGDSTIQVGFAGMLFHNDVTQWTRFDLPFEYYSAETPDTLGVILAATANADGFGNSGCELYVDGIEFTFATPVENIPAQTLLHFSPNPANKTLLVSYNCIHEHALIHIYDISGKEVYSSPLSSHSHVVPLQSFPRGIYQLVIYDGESVSSEQFIKE